MGAAKFLDLYELAVRQAMQQPVAVIGDYGVYLADLASIGRMRAALSGTDTSQGDA